MTTNKYIVHLVKKQDEDGYSDYDSCIEYMEAYNTRDCKNLIKEYYGNEWTIDYIAEVKYQRKVKE